MTQTAHSVSLHSPFALMFPDAVEEILERAEHLDLPTRHYSPLSRPGTWTAVRGGTALGDESSAEADDADDDTELPDIAVPESSAAERPLPSDDWDEEFDALLR